MFCLLDGWTRCGRTRTVFMLFVGLLWPFRLCVGGSRDGLRRCCRMSPREVWHPSSRGVL